MGNIVTFESLTRVAETPQDFYTVTRELREYINRLPLSQSQTLGLSELLQKQSEALIELILDRVKQSTIENGGEFSFTINEYSEQKKVEKDYDGAEN